MIRRYDLKNKTVKDLVDLSVSKGLETYEKYDLVGSYYCSSYDIDSVLDTTIKNKIKNLPSNIVSNFPQPTKVFSLNYTLSYEEDEKQDLEAFFKSFAKNLGASLSEFNYDEETNQLTVIFNNITLDGLGFELYKDAYESESLRSRFLNAAKDLND